MVPDCHRIHSALISVRPSPKFFTSDWFTQITILVTYTAIAVPLAFWVSTAVLQSCDLETGGLSSASAPDLPYDNGYDIFIEPFCIFITSDQSYIRSKSTSWVLVVRSARWLKQFVVNRHKGSQ